MKIKNSLKVLFLMSSVTTATYAQGWANWWPGAYIGVGAGMGVVHHANGILEDTTPQSFKLDMNKVSPVLNLLIGYAFKINSWHLGAEIDYLFSNMDASFSYTLRNNNIFAKLNSRNAFGAAFRVGYHCDRALGFIRLGLETRRFVIRANSYGDPAFPARTARNTIDATERKIAFSLGLGV